MLSIANLTHSSDLICRINGILLPIHYSRNCTISQTYQIKIFVECRSVEGMFMTDTEDLERLKAHFISMITHELRSPLNTINGYLDLTLEGIAGELNQQQREFVQRARAGSEHLYALIEDLLLISRADAEQLRLNLEAINLPEIVANAVED